MLDSVGVRCGGARHTPSLTQLRGTTEAGLPGGSKWAELTPVLLLLLLLLLLPTGALCDVGVGVGVGMGVGTGQRCGLE